MEINTRRKMYKERLKSVFIKKSIKAHGYKYDYSKVKYINNNHLVKIICPIHGVFNNYLETIR